MADGVFCHGKGSVVAAASREGQLVVSSERIAAWQGSAPDRMSDMKPEEVARRVAGGDRRACARLITQVEERDPSALAILELLPAGGSFKIGITGPPGAGKSTLVDLLVEQARAEGATVGVLAVDSSSLRTGGALLGDRIRMQGHATDPGVFIRSMGTRGHYGGLAAATADAARVLEAFGCSVILLETVGVGQSEVEVADLADVTILVLGPNSGDGIQAMKAGIMEVPDLFVVNKADLPGADATLLEIRRMLAEALDAPRLPGETPAAGPADRVLATRALDDPARNGVPELWRAIRDRQLLLAARVQLEEVP